MSVPFWGNPRGLWEQFIPVADGSPWDTCTLGGKTVPGIVRVEAEPGRKIDVKTAPGSDGATITDQGYEPAKPTIHLTIWTPEHFVLLQELLSQIVPKPGKSAAKPPPPVPIVHPAVNLLGITGVLITSVSTLKPAGGKGAFEMSIKTVQWLKAKAVVATPLGLNIPTTAGVEPARAPTPPSGTNKGP